MNKQTKNEQQANINKKQVTINANVSAGIKKKAQHELCMY